MGKIEARAEISAACLQCPEGVREDLQVSRKPLPAGIRLEDLSLMLERPSVRHTNGAREARRAQQF